MLRMSGQKTWYAPEFIPFGVQFNRKTKRVKVTYRLGTTTWRSVGDEVIAGEVHLHY